MPQTIADTVKALADFESELDKVKDEAAEAKKKLVKDAAEWAEAAKNNALAEVQKISSDRLVKARAEAEADAEEIRKKGQAATKKFAESISKNKRSAIELTLQRLLGEGQ